MHHKCYTLATLCLHHVYYTVCTILLHSSHHSVYYTLPTLLTILWYTFLVHFYYTFYYTCYYTFSCTFPTLFSTLFFYTFDTLLITFLQNEGYDDYNYLAMIMDEAHVACKFNKLHTTAYTLHSHSSFMISMTATPVITKFQVCIPLGPTPILFCLTHTQ